MLLVPFGSHKRNETVSLGDTAISLHTLQLQPFWGCQEDLPEFQSSWGGGGGGAAVFFGSQIVNWYSWQNVQKFCHARFWKPCIADSLSHTTCTCVETKSLADLPILCKELIVFQKPSINRNRIESYMNVFHGMSEF